MRQLETPRMNASAEACKNEDENAQFRAISGTSACFKIFKDAIHLNLLSFLDSDTSFSFISTGVSRGYEMWRDEQCQ